MKFKTFCACLALLYVGDAMAMNFEAILRSSSRGIIRELDLSNNQITKVPKEICNLKNLTRIYPSRFLGQTTEIPVKLKESKTLKIITEKNK